MNTSPDHPDFTALALGEHIHGTPARAVLDALRTSVAARNEAEQIRATAHCLTFALKGQPPLRLDAVRRHAVLHADIAAVRVRFAAEDRAAFTEAPAPSVERQPRTWVYPTLAAAAVSAAAIMVMKFLPATASPSQPNTPPVVRTDDEPTGRVMVVPPAPDSPARGRTLVPAPVPAVVDHAVKPPLPDKGRELPPAGELSSPVVKEDPPTIPPMPAPHLPATLSPPRDVAPPPAGLSPAKKTDPGSFATPRAPGKPVRQ